ncbi:MAG: 4Fe-4S binding protein, partial [Desulfovibrionaceae bacterium]
MSTPASGRPGSTFGPAAAPRRPRVCPGIRPRVRPRVRPATLRRWVRLVFALICLAGGLQLALYLLHAAGRIAFAAPRAPVVEGFLPIAALLGLKRWLTGGGFDPVHPAGLVILLAALASSFLLRRGFCGHVCPVGWLSEGLGRLGARLGLGRRGPRVLDWTLGAVKWLVLAFFLVQVGGMGAAALREFVTGPYNITADARLLTFWLAPSRVTLTALAGL